VAESRQEDEVPEPLKEGETLFRLQRKVEDLFFDHWKRGLVVLLGFLLLVLTVGTWKNFQRNTQRKATASIAAIDRKLPEVDQLSAIGLAPQDDLSDESRVQLLEAIAKKYEEVGASSKKAAASEAWLKAGDTWDRLGRPEDSARAYGEALAAFDMGPYGYSARNGQASAHLKQGNHEAAMTLFRAIVERYSGYRAERAQFDLSSALSAAGKGPGAIEALQTFQTRYPDSPLSIQVEEELNRLSAQAASVEAPAN